MVLLPELRPIPNVAGPTSAGPEIQPVSGFPARLKSDRLPMEMPNRATFKKTLTSDRHDTSFFASPLTSARDRFKMSRDGHASRFSALRNGEARDMGPSRTSPRSWPLSVARWDRRPCRGPSGGLRPCSGGRWDRRRRGGQGVSFRSRRSAAPGGNDERRPGPHEVGLCPPVEPLPHPPPRGGSRHLPQPDRLDGSRPRRVAGCSTPVAAWAVTCGLSPSGRRGPSALI